MAGKKSNPENIEVPNIKQMFNIIVGAKSRRDSALIATLYLTGARVSEVLCNLTPNQIELTELHGKKIVLISGMIVLKRNRKTKTKKEINKDPKGYNEPTVRRNVVIPYEKESLICDVLLKYSETISPDCHLFSITRQRAWQILHKYSLYPHILRHFRSTHLMSYYGLNEIDLMRFIGWKSTQQAARYSHLSFKDVGKKLIN